MVECKLDDGCCTSCKVCGHELLELIEEINQVVISDKKEGINYYPVSFVLYFLNVIKRSIEDD